MIFFTLGCTLGIWLLQQQARLPVFLWAWLLVGFGLVLWIPEKTFNQRMLRALFIAVFSTLIGFYHAAWQADLRLVQSLPYEFQRQDIELIGVVAELPHLGERGLRFAFDVERTLTPGHFVPPKIYLSSYFDLKNPPPDFHAGERWQLTVRLKQPHGSSNPNGFDFELWCLENKVRAVGYVNNKAPNHRLNARAYGFLYWIESNRESIRQKFKASLVSAPYAGVLTALAIGDQGSISAAQWQIYRRTGVIHLMSISGLHITMLAGMGFMLSYSLWRRSTRLTLKIAARKVAALVSLLVAISYALLSGYGVPAQRTVYMVAAVACALWLNRNFSLAQILAIALLGVLIPDPWAVLSPGFWLSFGSVSLIFYVTAHRIDTMQASEETAPAVGLMNKFRRTLNNYAYVQWAMSLGLIPPLLGLFGQVSLVSPLANAYAIPMISLIVVPFALLGVVLPIDTPLWIAHWVLEKTMMPLQYLSDLPAAVWMQHPPPIWCVIMGMLGVLWILTPRGFPARWLGILLMLPMFLNRPVPPVSGSVNALIFDVGQGLSVALQTQHHTLLYDSGPDFSDQADSGNRIIIPGLTSLGVGALDELMLSHDDIDHTGGTASILQMMPVARITSSLPANLMQTVPGLKDDIRLCQDGQSWDWDGVKFELLHPGNEVFRARSQDNERSCVLRIGTGNQHILLAGDIEKRGETALIARHEAQLAANVLVVPHHGSASSSSLEFVGAVLPDYAVFTVGYLNRFGHPKADITQRYRDSGASILRSDIEGAIQVSMNPQGYSIERYRASHQRYWMHTPKMD